MAGGTPCVGFSVRHGCDKPQGDTGRGMEGWCNDCPLFGRSRLVFSLSYIHIVLSYVLWPIVSPLSLPLRIDSVI